MSLVHFKSALRVFGKDKFVSFIKVAGLLIGTTSCFLLYHYCQYELSYDTHFKDSQLIYRLELSVYEDDVLKMESALSHTGLGPEIVESISGVDLQSRMLYEDNSLLRWEQEDKKIGQLNAAWVDSGFVEIFDLNLLLKQSERTLTDPHQALLSESVAKKIFGTDYSAVNPVGKTIYFNDNIPLTISGIYQDIPNNSHFKTDILISWTTLIKLLVDRYGEGARNFGRMWPPANNIVYTYLKLHSNKDIIQKEALINDILAERIKEDQKKKNKFNIKLQAVRDIHTSEGVAHELKPVTTKRSIQFLMLIGFLVALTSWINFTNLFIAKYLERVKEVALKKIMGAGKWQLAMQFLAESFFINLAAVVVSFLLCLLLFNKFQSIIDTPIPFNWDIDLLLFASAFLVFGTLIMNIYPNFVLSSLPITESLKNANSKLGSSHFGRILIIFQFTAASFLAIWTIHIYQQVQFMLNQELGINIEKTIVVNTPLTNLRDSSRVTQLMSFPQRVENNAAIKAASASGCIPGKGFLFNRNDFVRANAEEDRNQFRMNFSPVDHKYLELYEHKFLAGRNFIESTDLPKGNVKKVIITKKAMELFGFRDYAEAVGGLLTSKNNRNAIFEIVGVIEDFHHLSVHNDFEPTIFLYGYNYEFGYFSIGLNTNRSAEAVESIRKEWELSFPNDPFDYFFLDNFFERQYRHNQLFGELFLIFSAVIILMASVGIFGLAQIKMHQKRKPVAIRKVVGADNKSIFFYLLKDYLLLIGVASLISWLSVYYFIDEWLKQFAIRIGVMPLIFIITSAIILIISVLIISYHTAKVALVKPVNILSND